MARGGRNHWAAGNLDTGGGTGGGGGGGGGLPAAGPNALFSPTLSATRLPINWSTATVTGNKLSLAMINSTPYAALSDSGCRTYWPSAATPGRLTITSTGFNPGTYTYPCPAGAQPSVSGSDGPIQLAIYDGRWIDCYAVSGNTVTWNGNTGSCTVQGITIKNWQTGTGWPSGTIGNVNKFGFAACGASVSAGAITPEDKSLGYIAHALAMVLNDAGLADGPILPALREDSPNYPAGNTIFHQGSLLALPPTAPARPAGWTAWEHAIADGFANYGGYVMDRTGGWTIRCNTVQEPGVTATLASSDFAGFMSLTAGKLGKYLFDNLRQVTGAKPSIPHA